MSWMPFGDTVYCSEAIDGAEPVDSEMACQMKAMQVWRPPSHPCAEQQLALSQAKHEYYSFSNAANKLCVTSGTCTAKTDTEWKSFKYGGAAAVVNFHLESLFWLHLRRSIINPWQVQSRAQSRWWMASAWTGMAIRCPCFRATRQRQTRCEPWISDS